MSPRSDFLLGAGLGGLAAAIKIALVGHKVSILEAASKLAEVLFHISFTKVDDKRSVPGFKFLPILHDY